MPQSRKSCKRCTVQLRRNWSNFFYLLYVSQSAVGRWSENNMKKARTKTERETRKQVNSDFLWILVASNIVDMVWTRNVSFERIICNCKSHRTLAKVARRSATLKGNIWRKSQEVCSNFGVLGAGRHSTRPAHTTDVSQTWSIVSWGYPEGPHTSALSHTTSKALALNGQHGSLMDYDYDIIILVLLVLNEFTHLGGKVLELQWKLQNRQLIQEFLLWLRVHDIGDGHRSLESVRTWGSWGKRWDLSKQRYRR